MSDQITTLADALPQEQERVRKILGYYREIGPAGMFGAAMIEHALRFADKASASGDVIAMVQALKALQDIEA